MSDKLIQEKFNFIKNRPYKPSNYEGVSIFYDKNTFIKLQKNFDITISIGKIYLIIKKLHGLKDGSFDICNDTQVYNQTNSDVYCVLSDCVIYKEDNDNKLFIKNGFAKDVLL